MKTPEHYLDEVAKENGSNNFTSALAFCTKLKVTAIVKEAMLRHSKEACEEQRINCAEEARMVCNVEPNKPLYGHRCKYGYYTIQKQSILNAKSPIE